MDINLKKTGKIDYFSSKRGFGFIDYKSEKIFFHKSQINDEIILGDVVEFLIEYSEHTKGMVATNIKVISKKNVQIISNIQAKYNLKKIIDRKKVLTSISNNWKLEAKLENKKNYFFHSNEINSILNKGKYYVIGRKGSGKSSISEYLLKNNINNSFSEKLSFKNFPFNTLYNKENIEYTPPNQYITLWKYIIYSSIAKLMSKNENIHFGIREDLRKIYMPDPIKSLQRTIENWTSLGFGIDLFGHGGKFDLSKSIRNSEYTWIDKVNALEELINQYCDNSYYFIIFDELDEDYRVIKEKDHVQYKYLLTSLFKAVQDIKSIFSDKFNIMPIVFLRDDIYTLIQDADKNKWRDFKIEIEWNETKIKKMLAHRISVDAEIDNDITEELDFEDAWSFIFENHLLDLNKKTVHTFDFISKSTHLRPRDFIRYIQVCAEETLNLNRDLIRTETIKFVDRDFSNYLKDEIIDEIYPLIPEISEIFQIISNIRKWNFNYYEFIKEYKTYLNNRKINESNYDYVLDILYRFSVVGNQNKKRSEITYFKYLHTNMNLNKNEQLIIHRGLFKALQIV